MTRAPTPPERTGGVPFHLPGVWRPVAEEPGHVLASLDGAELAGGRLRVLLGPTSRFGARYFALLLEAPDGRLSREAVLRGLHQAGPLPSYNWIEVVETNERLTLDGGGSLGLGAPAFETLFARLAALLPPGGHLMVEYDSAARAETAQALAQGVPPLATALGELLFRVGCGPRFKDWQIAEGGREGPRKLQAYRPPDEATATRWQEEAALQLLAFLKDPRAGSAVVQEARERAREVLRRLRVTQEGLSEQIERAP